jgi:hypothetical protein
MSLMFRPVRDKQADNRSALAEGVKGIKCTHVGSYSDLLEEGALTLSQIQTLDSVGNVLSRSVGVEMGTIEVYENGAMNVYLKEEGRVTQYVIYRP